MVMRRINTLLILLLLLNTTLCLAARIEALPDRTRVALDESFNLELRADGSPDGDPDLSLLEQEFELLGRSQSSQMQIINGDISRTTVWSLTLMARSAGNKEIPVICVGKDCSEPLSIEVLPAGQGNNALAGENDLLLEVSTRPDKVWVQAQLLYKVRLGTRLNFLQASLSDPEPVGVEAVIQKLGEDRSYETEYNGLRYRVVERDYLIFPQQSGQLTIPPIRFAAQVAEGANRGFDPFRQRTRQIRRTSEEISIEVLSAPETDGRTWLPARDLQLEDDWRKAPQLIVGEPATRTITLRAQGVPAAQLPSLGINSPEGFRSYPDQPKRKDQFNEKGVIGELQEKVALVPTRPGTLRLDEIKIDWWDLNEERWRQARIPALEVEVLPATSQPALVNTPMAAPQEPRQQVEKSQGASPTSPGNQGNGLWPWLSLVLGGGWLLTLLIIIRAKMTQRRQENRQEQRETKPDLKAARNAFHQALGSNDSAQVRRALLNWGSALFPAQRPANLEELADLCGEPLQEQLQLFSRNLYSRESVGWDKQGLRTAAQQVEQQLAESESIDKLPPLYPHEDSVKNRT